MLIFLCCPHKWILFNLLCVFFHHWSICCFIWDVRWLLDYWMIFLAQFLLHYGSMNWQHALRCDDMMETFIFRCLEAGEWWCPALIWIWSLTDWLSGSANLEKEKSYQQQSTFFTPASDLFFPYCFEDNLQPYPKRLRCT